MHSLRRTDRPIVHSSGSSTRHSNESYDSSSTAPTSVSGRTEPSPRPSLRHAWTTGAKPSHLSYDAETVPALTESPRSSTDTYASTIPDDIYEEPEEYDETDNFEYDLPEYDPKPIIVESATEIRATTPQDFANYFPSQRRLYIHHDETTYDGNMNLRVDTELLRGTKKTQIQLFHLRMHDLKKREFSLRRYCRDSGREVCHSSRRYVKPASQRPGIQRSVSNALASLRSLRPDVKRSDSGASIRSVPKRHDSGYASNGDIDEEEELDEVGAFMKSAKDRAASLPMPTNTTKLEFSNYAQVDVKRRGAKNSKRYEFEYWGSTYSWKRVTEKDGVEKSISFHLVKDNTGKAIAHIVPELCSPAQARAEEEKGGWVPPCSLWISDPSVLAALTDVADVIISTGLIALVDDCIKRHFHSKPKHTTAHLTLPLTPLKLDLEFVSPKVFVNQMFRRKSTVTSASTDGTRPSITSNPTSLSKISDTAAGMNDPVGSGSWKSGTTIVVEGDMATKGSGEHRRSPLRFASPVETY